MDSIDLAQDITEDHIYNALKKHRVSSIPFSGFCLFCQDPVVERRYCDSHCREAHEAEQLRKTRS
jgi:hypothetical protein